MQHFAQDWSHISTLTKFIRHTSEFWIKVSLVFLELVLRVSETGYFKPETTTTSGMWQSHSRLLHWNAFQRGKKRKNNTSICMTRFHFVQSKMRIILCWGQRGGDALDGFFVYSWLFTAQAGSRSDGFYKLDDARRWRRVLSETIDATKVPNRVCKQVLLLFYSGEVMFRLSCRPQKEGLFGDKIIIHFWLKGEEIAINILQTRSSNHLYFSISAKWNLTSIDCAGQCCQQ